jgi:hypothetical protein
MKEIIATFADALRSFDSEKLASDFEEIADALDKSKLKTVEQINQALSKTVRLSQKTTGTTLGALMPALEAFHKLLVQASAKKKSIDSVKAMLDVFNEYSQLSTEEFRRALCFKTTGDRTVDQQLVATYLGKLEQALGDERKFPEVYDALTADKRIAQPEAVELASRFLAPIPKSTSRPKALRRVLYRHEMLLESRAKSASIGARR